MVKVKKKDFICIKCGAISTLAPSNLFSYDYRCEDCKNEYQRVWALKRGKVLYREYLKTIPENYRAKLVSFAKDYIPTTDWKLKDACRNFTRKLLDKNEWNTKPCEVCGKDPGEIHHQDYSDPFKIVWLCSPHHKAFHFLVKEKTPHEATFAP